MLQYIFIGENLSASNILFLSKGGKNIKKKIVIVMGVVLLLGGSVVSGLNGNIEKVENINNIKNLSSDILTLYPTDDTFIDQPAGPNLPRGDYEYMIVENAYGASGGGWQIDVLVNFDVSSIPSNATISFAKLYLYHHFWYANNPTGRNLNLYRIISNWDEETATWNAQPSYASQPSANSPVPSSTGMWMEWDVTEDIQDFINGLQVNCGWKVTDENYWGWYDIPQTFFRTKEFGYYFSPSLEIYGSNIPNISPSTPSINGPASGQAGNPLIYSVVSNDPEGSELYYYIDWGDGNSSGWMGPYDSGKEATLEHTWSERGAYTIKCKAKDAYGAESDWGTLEIAMPVTKSVSHQIGDSINPVLVVWGLFPKVNETTITYWALVRMTIPKDEFHGRIGKIMLIGFIGGPLN